MKKSYLFLSLGFALATLMVAPVPAIFADGEESGASEETGGDPSGNPSGNPDEGEQPATPSNPWAGSGWNNDSDGSGSVSNRPNYNPGITKPDNSTTDQGQASNTTNSNNNNATPSQVARTSTTSNSSNNYSHSKQAASGTTGTAEDHEATDVEEADDVDVVAKLDTEKTEESEDEAPSIVADIRQLNPWVVVGIFTLVATSVVGIAILATILMKKRSQRLAEDPKLLSE